MVLTITSKGCFQIQTIFSDYSNDIRISFFGVGVGLSLMSDWVKINPRHQNHLI